MSPGNGRMVRRAAILLTPVLPLAAMGVPGATVQQINRAFDVASVRIGRGEAVHFSNDDEFDHEVYVDSPGFNYESEEQAPGQTIAVTFTSAGTFQVKCHIHPKMHLRVEVVDPSR